MKKSPSDESDSLLADKSEDGALEAGGMSLSDADKVKIVTNLLTVTCGDSDAQPTISV